MAPTSARISLAMVVLEWAITIPTHMACNGSTHVCLPCSIGNTHVAHETFRWRYADVDKPYQVACRRRCRWYSARLVSRPCECSILYQSRRRHRSGQLLVADADRLWHRRPVQCLVRWQHLYTTGASTSKLYRCGGAECNHPSHRDSPARGRIVQCELHHLTPPMRNPSIADFADVVYLQCVDITFAEPEDVPKVTPDNCFNSSDISFQDVYYTNLTSAAEPTLASRRTTWMATIPLAAAVIIMTI